MREAKAKLKEFGIREKFNKDLKEKKTVLSEVKKNIAREFKYLKRYYNFEIENYHDPCLIYASSFLIYLRKGKADKNLADLITGFELLGTGVEIHDGNGINIFKSPETLEQKELTGDIDRNSTNFTLELLFGDIFYSRAVVYFMRYSNFEIFDEILKSLLKLHISRVILHRRLVDSINADENLFEKFKDSISEIRNLGAVLKSSFIVGLKFSGADLNSADKASFLDLAEGFSLLKAYKDINKFLNLLKENSESSLPEKYNHYILTKIEDLRNEISGSIEIIKNIENKNLFMKLLEIF